MGTGRQVVDDPGHPELLDVEPGDVVHRAPFNEPDHVPASDARALRAEERPVSRLFGQLAHVLLPHAEDGHTARCLAGDLDDHAVTLRMDVGADDALDLVAHESRAEPDGEE